MDQETNEPGLRAIIEFNLLFQKVSDQSNLSDWKPGEEFGRSKLKFSKTVQRLRSNGEARRRSVFQ